MKLLVVSLALTIFAGSQAFVLRDESNSKVDELKQELNQCVEQLFNAFYGKYQMVEESEIYKALNSWFNDHQEKFQQRKKALEDALPPEVKEIEGQASSAYRDVQRKFRNDLWALDGEVHAEKEAFYQALEHDLNPILEKLDPYTQPVRHGLVRTCTELDEKLTEFLKPHLDRLQPLAKEIPSTLQNMKDSLDPAVDQVQKYILTEVGKVHDVLQKSAARVLGFFNKYLGGFDQWVRSSLFPEDQ